MKTNNILLYNIIIVILHYYMKNYKYNIKRYFSSENTIALLYLLTTDRFVIFCIHCGYVCKSTFFLLKIKR